MMAVGSFIVSVVLTLLLIALTTVVITVISSKWPTANRFLTDRRNVIITFLVLFLFLIPISLLLFGNPRSSLQSFLTYTRELLISIIFVASFIISWRMINTLEVTFKQLRDVFTTAKRAIMDARKIIPSMRSRSVINGQFIPQSQASSTSSVWQSEINLDEALSDLDKNKVPESDVKEMDQILSLFKWIEQGDIIGLYELQEEAYFGDGLHPRVRSIVEGELQQIQQDRSKATMDQEYEGELRNLLYKHWPIQVVDLEFEQVHHEEYGPEIQQNRPDEYEKWLKSIAILSRNRFARKVVKTGANLGVFVHHKLHASLHRN